MEHIELSMLKRISEIDRRSDYDHALQDVDILLRRGMITEECREVMIQLIRRIGGKYDK